MENTATETAETTATAPEQTAAPEQTTDTNETNQVDTQAADQNAETTNETNPAEPKESAQTLKIKVGGKEREVSQNELIQGYQLAAGAREKMREAQETLKQAKSVLENPFAYLQQQGITQRDIFAHLLQNGGEDVQQVMNEFLQERFQLESMTPEERERYEMSKRLKTYEEREAEERQRFETEQREAQQQQAIEHFRETYKTNIGNAIKTAGLPDTPYTVSRFAVKIQALRSAGHDGEINYGQVAEIVKQEIDEERNSLLSALDAETIIKHPELGKKVKEKFKSAASETPVKIAGQKTAEQPKKFISTNEWREQHGL